ncbi:MAG: hypothetical protein DRN12_03915 [Thermoplasmata archaeon]|nr:MAG: hypothetical protein DRN12_03915 [Thermoplasmata archaeon]
MGKYYPDSKVEISGFAAKHYDRLLDIFTLNRYKSFIKKAIQLMNIKPSDKILDLGADTGRNSCLMRNHLLSEGEIIGLDISNDMIAQFKDKCKNYSNIKILNKRIDLPLDYNEYFDKAFISFVLHGFPQEAREIIIDNVFRALKENGEFFILDYNSFSLDESPFYIKSIFKLIECHYAYDFIERDWQEILLSKGFNNFKEHLFFRNYIRLIKVVKEG